MIKGLLLDFDDTLADSSPGRRTAMRRAIQEHLGLTMSDAEITQALLRNSNIEAIMDDLAPNNGLGPHMVRSFREYYYGKHREPLELFHGVREVLDALQQHGFPLVLVTSRFRHKEEEGLTWGVLQELEHLGIREHFAAVVGYEDTEQHKPHPAPFLAGLGRLGLKPAEVMAVGDSPLDIHAARQAAMPTVGALWGALDPDALQAANPDFTLARPKDLLTLISSLSG